MPGKRAFHILGPNGADRTHQSPNELAERVPMRPRMHWWMRPGCCVALRLPVRLTPRDVERLTEYLESLITEDTED